jgi:hypothetical protein
MFQNEEDKKDIYRSIKKYFEQFTKLLSRGKVKLVPFQNTWYARL